MLPLVVSMTKETMPLDRVTLVPLWVTVTLAPVPVPPPGTLAYNRTANAARRTVKKTVGERDLKKINRLKTFPQTSLNQKARQPLQRNHTVRIGLDEGPQAIFKAVSYTHLRAHETGRNLVCRL